MSEMVVLTYLVVSTSTFKGLGEAVADPGAKWMVHPEPVRLFSDDTRRHLQIGNVVFIENTPHHVTINLEVN